MNITELRFDGFDARAERGLIRWALFEHHDVADVEVTAQADTLRVVHRGPADPQGWASTLVQGDLPAPRVVAGHATSPVDALHGASA
jgi:hypothetical protein